MCGFPNAFSEMPFLSLPTPVNRISDKKKYIVVLPKNKRRKKVSPFRYIHQLFSLLANKGNLDQKADRHADTKKDSSLSFVLRPLLFFPSVGSRVFQNVRTRRVFGVFSVRPGRNAGDASRFYHLFIHVRFQLAELKREGDENRKLLHFIQF